MAESGTGVGSAVVELDEPLPFWPLEEVWFEEVSEVVGVEDESVAELALDVLRLVLLDDVVVVLPVVEVRVFAGEDELSPVLDEGVRVLTVPLEAEEVLPDVLCALELEAELVEPWR